MSYHRILITREAGQGLYVVAVEPEPTDGAWGATYATHRDAAGYAGGLRMVKGWPVVDLTEAAGDGA